MHSTHVYLRRNVKKNALPSALADKRRTEKRNTILIKTHL